MKTSLLFLILFTPFINLAQKQGNIWYFGTQSGLDFSGGAPVAITGGQTGTDIPSWDSQEGTASIADSSGTLLFYTGGKTAWNKIHTPMPNGSGLMGGTSSTQSSIIIPQPGNDSLFYLFTSDEFQNYNNPPETEKGYRYSVINMCLDSGNGDVLADKKNMLLLDSATEKLAACQDLSGAGYWVMGHKIFSNEFMAWHLTASGISSTVISHSGSYHGMEYAGTYWEVAAAQGQMKFNPAGTKLALVLGNNDPAVLDIFDFNAGTGIVSNCCHMAVDSVLGARAYGLEFSPDNSKLYITVSGGSVGIRIYQYDLTAGGGSCSSIAASRTILYQSHLTSVMFGMQLAPDNKIYVVCNSYHSLGCINSPNLPGTAANFNPSAISLSGVINNYTLPSFIAGYKYHNGLTCCHCDPVNNPPAIIDVVLPNIFTPNNDGINDIVDFSGLNLNESVVTIFNRWGEKVFETTDVIKSWNGKNLKGINCNDDVYYYILQSKGAANAKYNRKGFIQLLR